MRMSTRVWYAVSITLVEVKGRVPIRMLWRRIITSSLTSRILECKAVLLRRLDAQALRGRYCIPDGYEVIDASLDDIRYNLNPTFTRDMLNSTIDKCNANFNCVWGYVCVVSSATAIGFTLDGRPFLPGCVGLNTISGGTDYLNVIVQILQQVSLMGGIYV